MQRRYGIENIQILKGKNIFVDANILIYLFWATGKSECEKKYAAAFQKLRIQKNKLFIDFLIIAEVVNVAIRHRKQELKNNEKSKPFRNSPAGQIALSEIYTTLKDQILNNFKLVEGKFSLEEIRTFLTVDKLDFPDKAILKICQENKFILFTHDRDFKDSQVDILTDNAGILTGCEN